MGRISALLLAVLVTAVVACGTGSRRGTPGVSSLSQQAMVACPGPGGIAAEFARQQALVHWPVYCPTALPEGFRLATADDRQDPVVLGGDVSPTRDDLNPGGGTFITRFVGPGDAELVIVQGAGADIYVHRDTSGNLIGAGPDAPDAAVGDLAGKALTIPSPSVTAFDPLGFGHMLIGTRMSLEQVTRSAASMTPVDRSGLRLALLSGAELGQIAGDNWVVSWPPDPTGEDVRAPSVCGKGLDRGDRIAEAVVRFEFAPWLRTAADAGGHGPFLQQAVASFPPGGAQRYIEQMAGILDRCPPQYEQKAVDGSHAADVTLTRIDSPDLGDRSLVYRRSLRSPVQGMDTDVALIQRGDSLAIMLRIEVVAADGAAAAGAILPYARLADQKLQALAAKSPANNGTPATATPIATPDVAVRSAVLARLPLAVFPRSFAYVPYDWSPDGQRLAFIGDERALYIADAPAYAPYRLADGPASEPRWSPDGKLIAFAHEDDGAPSNIAPDDGIEIISPDFIDSTRPLRVSPFDDEWRGRIIQIYSWIDDRTIAYDAHCGSGCQMLFEMTVVRPSDGSAPRMYGAVRQVPFVRNCAECLSAGLAFYYSPDNRYVAAETGTVPALALYERATDTQWLLTFGDEPMGVDLRREFVAWDAESASFLFREAIVPFGEQPSLWTYWRAVAGTRTRTQVPAGEVNP
jgi:hypothetical protein